MVNEIIKTIDELGLCDGTAGLCFDITASTTGVKTGGYIRM